MNVYDEYAKQYVAFTEIFDNYSRINTTLVTIPTEKINTDWIDKIRDTMKHHKEIIDVKILTPDPLSPDYLTVEIVYIVTNCKDGHENIVKIMKGIINE